MLFRIRSNRHRQRQQCIRSRSWQKLQNLCTFSWCRYSSSTHAADLHFTRSLLLVTVASRYSVRQEPLARLLAGSLRGKVPRLP